MLEIRIKQQKIDIWLSWIAKGLFKILKWLISVLRYPKPQKMSSRTSSTNICKVQIPSITNVQASHRNFKWTLPTRITTIKNSCSLRLKIRIERDHMSTVVTLWCSPSVIQKKTTVMEPQQSTYKSRTTPWLQSSTHMRMLLASIQIEATYRIINRFRNGILKVSLGNPFLGQTRVQRSL